MRKQSIRWAVWFAALIAVLAPFLILDMFDRQAPLGVQATIQISGSSPRVSSADTLATIERLAAESHSNIAKLVDNVRSPGNARDLYLAIGDSASDSASWLTHGYPDFSRTMTTRVHTLAAAAGQDPRGLYFVYGTPTTAAKLKKQLTNQGYEIAAKTDYTISAIGFLLTQPVGIGIAVGALLLAMLAGMYSLLNGKSYAVQGLQGRAFWQMTVLDLKVNLFACSLGTLVVAASTAVASALYNGGSHWPPLAFWCCTAFLALLFLLVIAYLIGFWLAQSMPLLQALKGKLPVRMACAAIYCVRIPALIVTIWAISLAGLTVSTVAVEAQTQGAWKSASEDVRPFLSPNMSPEEEDAYIQRTGRWLISAENEGKMILAREQSPPLSQPSSGTLPDQTANFLLVNDVYLHEQVVTDRTGRRLSTAGSKRVLLILPSSEIRQDALLSAARQWVNTQASRSGITPPEVELALRLPGQQFFGYGSSLAPTSSTLCADFPLLVVNSGTGVLTTDDYGSFASQGDALLIGMNYAISSSRKAGLGQFIYAFANVAQQAADRFSKAKTDLYEHIVNLIVAFIVLIVSALAAAQTVVRGRAQRIFSRYVNGWSFFKTHAVLLSVEAVLFLTPVLWFSYQAGLNAQIPAAQKPVNPLVLGGWQPLLVVIVTGVSFLACTLALRYYTQVIVRTHSREE
ncbi:hypothetical protein KIM372_17270 [Bombiscardovia nodaiensis]|uniref:Uncharacterized protein n=1 Tax=Bombiscardovia nodaiensis TaxID=2932181 RepID=A0ABM8BA79_9BIFI|nr:hypothetical protein KIM372_17270 [Bombiscardovia nodaiensis]